MHRTSYLVSRISRDDGMRAELCAQQTGVEKLRGGVEGSVVVGVGVLLLPWMGKKLAIVCLCVEGRGRCREWQEERLDGAALSHGRLPCRLGNMFHWEVIV